MQVAAAAEAAGAVVAEHRRQLAAGLAGAQRHATPTPDGLEPTASPGQLVSRAASVVHISISCLSGRSLEPACATQQQMLMRGSHSMC